ncbi:DUF3619 family protein [Pelomonas sp. SE-A7]|uniref:DUF3619 family protein n=1 Tax=Pelomonas sp. SE-A7 TaxID=3054953 RepID=UPI00259CBFE0|nr:DUF3619 family protein [Pelomonas sp. SE-A7]MDM4767437.1 DUF3619 family protein [Pelomonas sp. SE-A7]
MNESRQTTHDTDELVSRFASRVTASLDQQMTALPVDITERLRFAREQALTKARRERALAAASAVKAVAVGGGAMALAGNGRSPRWLKLASLLPLLLLIAGLLLIQQSQWYEQITAAAEVDTALLSDKLPPAAYSDPGFKEYLQEDEQQQSRPQLQQQQQPQKQE